MLRVVLAGVTALLLLTGCDGDSYEGYWHADEVGPEVEERGFYTAHMILRDDGSGFMQLNTERGVARAGWALEWEEVGPEQIHMVFEDSLGDATGEWVNGEWGRMLVTTGSVRRGFPVPADHAIEFEQREVPMRLRRHLEP